MNNKTAVGLNRTGAALSPRMTPEMVRSAEMFAPLGPPPGTAMERIRATYMANAMPHGTMPPPASLKEAGLTALEMMKGNKAIVFTDKLGARLAFERTGARLYEALLSRIDAGPTWEGGPSRVEAEKIHAEEVRHFHLVKSCIEELGGDPTLQTPSADVDALASMGVIKVLGDPRMSLRHALHGILVAELVDTEGWSTLIELASSLGHEEMASRFREAHLVEEQHLVTVRGWLRTALLDEANMELEEEADGEPSEVAVH